MKTVVLSKHKLPIAISIVAGLSLSLTLGVSAQTPAPTPIVPANAPTATRQAAPVVAPVVPNASSKTSGAVDALEQAANTPAATNQVVAPQSQDLQSQPAGYVVPPASNLGLFEGSSQKLREMAFLKTEVELNKARQARLESMSTLNTAEKIYADPSYDPKAPKDQTQIVNGKAVPVSVTPVAVEPQPYVNSVYGFGDQMYAEIIILGTGKVLASKGTVLADGSKVISVSNNGVVVSGKKGTRRIPIRGAAGY